MLKQVQHDEKKKTSEVSETSEVYTAYCLLNTAP